MLLVSGLSDHEGVLLRITDPTHNSRINKEKRVYPPPATSVLAVTAACKAIMEGFDLSIDLDPLVSGTC